MKTLVIKELPIIHASAGNESGPARSLSHDDMKHLSQS